MNGCNFRYCTIGSLLLVLPDVGHEELRRNGLWNMTNFTIMARYLFSTKIRIELWPSPGHEEHHVGWIKILLKKHKFYVNFLSLKIQLPILMPRDWSKKKPGLDKDLTTNKKSNILSYHRETWSKGTPHNLFVLTKFHDDSSKIVVFLLIVNFWSFPILLDQSL